MHPAQLAVFEVVLDLLLGLPATSEADEVSAQQSLMTAFHGIERWYGDATRHVKRGDHPGGGPGQAWGWLDEQECARRAIAQLRTVGDALAWGLYGFDRRYIWALSRNAGPGALAHKKGFAAEKSTIDQLWTFGRFGLLHDLTNSLRIGDVSARNGNEFELFEIKAGVGRPTAAQRLRMLSIEKTLNEGAPLQTADGQVDLFASSVRLKTHMEELRSALIDAADDRVVTREIGQGMVLLAWSPLRAVAKRLLDERRRELVAARYGAFVTSFGNGNYYHYVSFNSLPGHPAHAPRSVFPLPAWQRAALACDYLSYEVGVSVEAFVTALKRVGFTPEVVGKPGTDLARIVIRARRGGRLLALNNATYLQPLVELLDLDTFAEALSEYHEAGAVGRMTVTFADEDRVWRARLDG